VKSQVLSEPFRGESQSELAALFYMLTPCDGPDFSPLPDPVFQHSRTEPEPLCKASCSKPATLDARGCSLVRAAISHSRRDRIRSLPFPLAWLSFSVFWTAQKLLIFADYPLL